MASKKSTTIDLKLDHAPALPQKIDYAIGCIGSGFIMRDIQVVAYRNAGMNVHAIASRTPANAKAAATARGIPKVYDTWHALLDDKDIEIVDIAFPPDQQLEIVAEACQRKHIKGILAQKPIAMNYDQAKKLVALCDAAGKTLAVNQNMRWDQSMRALKTLLDRGTLGTPVIGTIEMRGIPHWQPFLKDYDRLTLLNMSIHHLDVFRFLFGDPERILCSVRTDPRTTFKHTDGIALYILEYANGFRASSWDDVWTGPVREGSEGDIYIKWRVEGTDGMAHGTIGWVDYPNGSPSTINFTTKQQPGYWLQPRWKDVWFPDAFSGPMGELMRAIQDKDVPANNGHDNLRTMALVDAAYKSAAEHRGVTLAEMLN